MLPYEASKLKVKGYVFLPENPLVGTTPRGDGAHVEGWKNFAYTDSHAEGVRNIALGKFSHAQGIANKTGWCSTAIGKGNSALGFESIAMGGAINGDSSDATYDSNAVVISKRSLAWSGNGKYVIPEERIGTFNINPANGYDGIYVGDRKSTQDVTFQPQNGIYACETNEEVEKCKESIPTMEQVFNKWVRFGHNKGKQYGIDADYDGGQRPGAGTWSYDSTQKSIKQPINTTDFTGFVSNKMYYDYQFRIRCYSTDGDDDFLGIVMGFVEDANGRQHTLSLIRSPQSSDKETFPSRWAVFLDADGANHGLDSISYNTVKLWDYDDDTTKTCYTKILNEKHGGWSSLGKGALLDVIRTGNKFTCVTSLFSSGNTNPVLDPDTTVVIDIDALITKYASNASVVNRLKLFRNKKVRIGYCTQSQPATFFENIIYPEQDTQIVDLYNDQVWKYNATTKVWYVDAASKTTGVIPQGRLANNDLTKKLFFNNGSQIITLGGCGSSEILKGQTFDLGTGQGTLDAMAAIITALGGTAIIPSDN